LTRIRLVALLALVFITAGFVATWRTVPHRSRTAATYPINYPARLFARDLVQTTRCRKYQSHGNVGYFREDIPKNCGIAPANNPFGIRITTPNRIAKYHFMAVTDLEQRVEVIFGGTALVVVLGGLVFGAPRRD
jgi:hypothetical protein